MPQDPGEPSGLQRALIERARARQAEARKPVRRPLLPRLVSLAVASAAALVLFLVFDRFLAAIQRYLDLPVTVPGGTEAPAPDAPLPVFVVEEPPAPAPPAASAPATEQ
jgi:hypothetical protein